MRWQAYKIVLRLQTPMHMGRAKLGNLQATRPYVHGKALWGALTARITRESTPAQARDYREIGKQVSAELAFSYLYPTVSDDVDLWPWEDPERFAWRFLGSYAGTALNYNRNSAAEGSLHETEFIAPATRDGQPVKLVGYIFEKEGCTLSWAGALHRLQMGGERTYGWGRVQCLEEPQAASFLFGYPLELASERPVVFLPENAALPAHALAHGEQAIPASGRVIPLVGRETRTADGHGRHVNQAIICWEPGSTVGEQASLQIGKNGIWEAAS